MGSVINAEQEVERLFAELAQSRAGFDITDVHRVDKSLHQQSSCPEGKRTFEK